MKRQICGTIKIFRLHIHIIPAFEVLPRNAVGVILLLSIHWQVMFVQMVEDSICDSSYSPCVFADLFQKLRFLLVWFRIFCLCHFEMTRQEYLSFLMLEYMRLRNIFLKYTNGITSHNKHVKLLNL
jgi:hypothetical protein